MTALVTSDWHLSENPRDAYRWRMLTRLRNFAAKKQVSHVLILGDLTSAKDNHSAVLVNRVVELLAEYAKIAHVILLRGNHDAADADNPFFQFTRRLDNITYVHDPQVIELLDVGWCLFLPWAATTEFWQDINFGAYAYVFAHNTFAGARGSHGFALDGFDVGIFPSNTHVISGDVHVPQRVGPVTYVGAPYTVDFGDDYEPRVLLIDSKSIKSVKSLSGPRKVLIEIADLHQLKLLKATRGDIAKVRVHIPSEETSNWEEIRRAVRAWGEAQGIQVWSVTPIAPQGLAGPLRGGKRRSLTDVELVRAYASRAQVDAATIEVGVKLCEEVA